MTLTFNTEVEIRENDYQYFRGFLIKYKHHPVIMDEFLIELINMYKLDKNYYATLILFDLRKLYKESCKFTDFGLIYPKSIFWNLIFYFAEFNILNRLFKIDSAFKVFGIVKVSTGNYYCEDIQITLQKINEIVFGNNDEFKILINKLINIKELNSTLNLLHI